MVSKIIYKCPTCGRTMFKDDYDRKCAVPCSGCGNYVENYDRVPYYSTVKVCIDLKDELKLYCSNPDRDLKVIDFVDAAIKEKMEREPLE